MRTWTLSTAGGFFIFKNCGKVGTSIIRIESSEILGQMLFALNKKEKPDYYSYVKAFEIVGEGLALVLILSFWNYMFPLSWIFCYNSNILVKGETIMAKTIHTDKAPAATGPMFKVKLLAIFCLLPGQVPLSLETGEIIMKNKLRTNRTSSCVGGYFWQKVQTFDHVVKTTCFLSVRRY